MGDGEGATERFEPGSRFHQPLWEDEDRGENIWSTFGFRRLVWEPGRTVIEWDATPRFGFPRPGGGHIVQGGIVAVVLDAAMAGACISLLNVEENFLTADLRAEYLRGTRVGRLRAEGRVVHRTRRAVFCAASVFDEAGKLSAAGRCTQIVLPAEG